MNDGVGGAELPRPWGPGRDVAPQVTLERVKPLLRPCGITRVANITGLDRVGIPVVTVCRPNARSLSVSQGKGLDLCSAKASGVMEAIELFYAERPSLPLRLASFAELEREARVIDVEGLPRLTVSRFHRHLPLLWVTGESLVDQAPVQVPYELVHANFSLPLPTGSGAFAMSTNGLASGNTRDEAVSHALCEVIERDATALFFASSREERGRRRIDLQSVDDAACRALLECFQRAGLLVGVWETTSDVGVPAFNCTLLDESAGFHGRLYAAGGMGCHPHAGLALCRALTEAAQSRLTYIAGSRDDATQEAYSRGQDPQTLERFARELGEMPADARRFDQIRSQRHATIAEQIGWLLGQLSRACLEQAALVDLSPEGAPIHVVRVVVPGLEHTPEAPGYQPGKRARALA